jgi:hypothetical protein
MAIGNYQHGQGEFYLHKIKSEIDKELREIGTEMEKLALNML